MLTLFKRGSSPEDMLFSIIFQQKSSAEAELAVVLFDGAGAEELYKAFCMRFLSAAAVNETQKQVNSWWLNNVSTNLYEQYQYGY